MGITIFKQPYSKFSFGEVNHRIYLRKSHFTAPLARRWKTKFPTVYQRIYLPKWKFWIQLIWRWKQNSDIDEGSRPKLRPLVQLNSCECMFNPLPPGKYFQLFLLFCRLLIIFNQFFWQIHPAIPSECQTVWIQIRPDILTGLIWVKTVCKSYQRMTSGGNELNGDSAKMWKEPKSQVLAKKLKF